MKTTFIIFTTLILIFIISTLVSAQPGLPGNPDQAPIDGGLGLLAAAGGAYAWKKLKNRNQNDDIST